MTRPLDELLTAAAANTQEPLYADRDPFSQGAYRWRHVDRMTREGLHSKAAIADELAHRDMLIDELAHHARELRERVAVLERELGGRMYELLKMGQERDELRTKLDMQTAESDAMYECIQELRAEVARLTLREDQRTVAVAELQDIRGFGNAQVQALVGAIVNRREA